jgi:hypothetical protein
MSGVVTRRFRIHNAEQFHEAFSEAVDTKMYMFIARINEWADGDVTPVPIDTVRESRYEPWRNMIAAKRIQSSDVSFCINRYNWASGTVYAEYDDTSTTLYQDVFYVVTTDFNVYKCLFNNNGATSTVKPTGTSTAILSTADGYKWKFMYSISAADTLKFVTSGYIPVKTLTADDGSTQWDVQSQSTNNSIDVIDITAGGSGYAYRANTLASVTNSTVVVLDSSASGVDEAYTGSAIYISGGLGSGQLANVASYAGGSKTVTLTPAFTITPNSSSSYHIGPKVIINGDSATSAKAYANVEAGVITHVNMIVQGLGYTRANVELSGTGGVGATAVPRISPPGGHGSDPIGELGGHNVMLNVRLSGTEGNNFPTNNDFRIIGVLKDPLTANDVAADSSAYDQTTKLTVSGITGGPFYQDELVIGTANNATGRIVEFANTNAAGTAGVLKVIDVSGTFEAETITGNTTSATATVSSIAGGELRPYSGDIIYRENRSVTSRSADQIEDIKIVVRY